MDVKDLKILLIDDSFEAINIIKGMLKSIEVDQIFTAKDGKEGLDFLGIADDMIDVVLCDWNMPRISGLELLTQLRSCDPDLPFLMITGASDYDSVAAAKSAGVTGYLRKPFSPLDLEKKLTVVSRMIEARQSAMAE